jgi:hypothetical protein
LLADLFAISLATWVVVWALTFWHKTEFLRSWLGIYFIVDEQGLPMEREDQGGVGGWLNCPMCCVTLVVGLVVILWAFAAPVVWVLAAMGASLLIVRWYESLRPKREWWL